jgi:hypothetical protein
VHIAADDEMEDGHPVRQKRDSTTPTKARFMRHPHEKLSSEYSLAGPKRSTAHRIRESGETRRGGPGGRERQRAVPRLLRAGAGLNGALNARGRVHCVRV